MCARTRAALVRVCVGVCTHMGAWLCTYACVDGFVRMYGFTYVCLSSYSTLYRWKEVAALKKDRPKMMVVTQVGC